MRRRSFRGAVAVMALTTAALIGTAGSALACYSDDGRSNPIPDRNHAPCADGQKLQQSDVDIDAATGEGKSSLTITKVHDGVTVTRIVIIGGDDGFNEYIPGKVGKGGKKLAENAPWTDLKATKTFKGRQPNIDKWFLCGKKTEKPTQTVTPPTKTSTPATSTKPSAPATSDTSVSPTSTTAPAVVPAGNESGTGGGLANTGFDNSWLIWVGALLLAAGGGLLALLKFRRKASE
ncbi:LPXTG cell wall anchor domain-containing protein [Amycolatopsis sp. NPDC051045]|uniref:LPXTG cell wall anchor domain-containing protein n=1 Tax=Amycolatopsis sp. NPDC051045 TaxID=3156922 RepID=UPI0034449978